MRLVVEIMWPCCSTVSLVALLPGDVLDVKPERGDLFHSGYYRVVSPSL